MHILIVLFIFFQSSDIWIDDNRSFLTFEVFNSIQILGKDLYKVVKEKYGPNLNKLTSEKVTIVNGDICLEDLGLQDFDLAHEMLHQVDAIVNLAATTKFDERC